MNEDKVFFLHQPDDGEGSDGSKIKYLIGMKKINSFRSSEGSEKRKLKWILSSYEDQRRKKHKLNFFTRGR
jgi:hypothetical protein